MGRIAACKGGGLVLDADLSMQLVVSPALRALVREANIPVELFYDQPFWPDSLLADWQRLDVPVRQCPVLSGRTGRSMGNATFLPDSMPTHCSVSFAGQRYILRPYCCHARCSRSDATHI